MLLGIFFSQKGRATQVFHVDRGLWKTSKLGQRTENQSDESLPAERNDKSKN